MKVALRRGMRADPPQATSTVPELDMVEVRRVVQAAVTSALSRFEGLIGGSAATTPAEKADEVEDLLDAFEDSLVLGEDV